MTKPVALVTGGALRIGAAISLKLAEAGYAVAIHCRRSRDAAEALAARIRQGGGQADVLAADLADLAGIEVLVAAASERGPLRLLVNNASVFDGDRLETLQIETAHRNIDVNLLAPVFLAKAFAAQVPAGEEGAIVNLIDQRVLRPNPLNFSYLLAKSALWTATQTMAQALAPHIRVNAVGPGPTLPNIHDGEAGFAQEAAHVPLERAVAPEEIAEAVLYLARARSVTGQMVAVDGGQHLAWKTPDVVG